MTQHVDPWYILTGSLALAAWTVVGLGVRSLLRRIERRR